MLGMFLLIATIIFASVITFFATLNAGPVDIHLKILELTNVALYWVVLGSVLVTLIFSWIVSLITSVSSSFAMHGKENIVKQLKKENEALTEKVHQLEVENARLQGKKEAVVVENKVS